MSLLEVTGLSHTFGDKLLYRNASFTLLKGEHMGVVGQNGTGKSTLIKLLTGEVIPDEGEIRWQPAIRVGDLNQYAEVDGTYTVQNYLRTAFADLFETEEQMTALYDQAALTGDEAVLHQAAELQERLESAGFYQVESDISRMVNGLGIGAYGLDTPLEQLSGGQRAKVILAKLLLEQADILLLDEPTNFLDKEHVSWLSEYLTTFPGAFIVVSHDFDFLEKITTCILDIEFQTVRKYNGKYSDFLRQKGQQREDYIRQYNAQRKQIEKTEAFIRKNKAGVNSKMARGRQKQLDRLERLGPPSFVSKPVIQFQSTPLSAQKVLTVEGLEVGYSHALLPKISFSMFGGQRLVVSGFNGIGKSTLLKTLVGEIPAVGGGFRFSELVRVGYYEQDLHWGNPQQTPLDLITGRYPALGDKAARAKLAQCGVRADHVRQSLETLSGGEQSKVKLCSLLLTPCNFLILDEPTNHLDHETKEALEEALIDFEGCILLVSHEESFYRDWADHVFQIG